MGRRQHDAPLIWVWGAACGARAVAGGQFTLGRRRKDAACLFTDPDHGLVEQSYLPPFLPGIESAGKYDRNHGINEMAGALPLMTTIGET